MRNKCASFRGLRRKARKSREAGFAERENLRRNMVTLQVWAEGADPASGIALKRIPVTINGGSAEGKWSYRLVDADKSPESEPSFTFSAHSAWCAYKMSEKCTIKLKRPQITRTDWKDKDGKSASKGLVGEELRLSASCNGDTEEGAGVTFKIYKDGENPVNAMPAAQLGGTVAGGVAEAEWIGTDSREAGDTGALKYFFTAEMQRATNAKSNTLELKNPQVISMEWEKQAVYYGEEVKLKIKTFEVKELSPACKLQLWQKGAKEEDGYLFEEELMIDAEEKELTVKMDFEYAKLKDGTAGLNTEIYAKLICSSMSIQNCAETFLSLLEFNPYKGKKYQEIYNTANGVCKGINMDTEVVDNPGFAPTYVSGVNVNSYAGTNGFFNEDYLDVKRGNGKTYRQEGFSQFTHEGIDFKGTIGTPIHSFIYGTVLAYGWFETYGRTIFIAKKGRKGIYLLAHLNGYNKALLDKKEIKPGEVVGYVGGSGNGKDNTYGVHLHISYFDYQYGEGDKIVFKTGETVNKGSQYIEMYDKIANPILYTEKKIENTKGKIY